MCRAVDGADARPPQVFPIKDPAAKATYTADLGGGPTVEAGCIIKLPAKVACVPSAKTNVVPAPPGGGGTGTRAFADSGYKGPFSRKG